MILTGNGTTRKIVGIIEDAEGDARTAVTVPHTGIVTTVNIAGPRSATGAIERREVTTGITVFASHEERGFTTRPV